MDLFYLVTFHAFEMPIKKERFKRSLLNMFFGYAFLDTLILCLFFLQAQSLNLLRGRLHWATLEINIHLR